MNRLAIIAIQIALLWSTGVYAQELNADVSKSTLKWNAQKVSGEHYGQIKLKEGTFTINDNQIVSGNFVIDMQTITCEDIKSPEWNKKLVDHLNSNDFFGVSKYSTAQLSNLKSGKFQNGMTVAEADLTIKGETHPVKFEITANGKSYRAKIKVDRTKYNIRYGSGKFFDNLGDKAIHDEFTLDVVIEIK
ncbi:MAG: YceI family protein [Bacteroidales bacterium]|nr:YceI family protein [Bacteroidales bacterium]